MKLIVLVALVAVATAGRPTELRPVLPEHAQSHLQQALGNWALVEAALNGYQEQSDRFIPLDTPVDLTAYFMNKYPQSPKSLSASLPTEQDLASALSFLQQQYPQLTQYLSSQFPLSTKSLPSSLPTEQDLASVLSFLQQQYPQLTQYLP